MSNDGVDVSFTCLWVRWVGATVVRTGADTPWSSFSTATITSLTVSALDNASISNEDESKDPASHTDAKISVRRIESIPSSSDKNWDKSISLDSKPVASATASTTSDVMSNVFFFFTWLWLEDTGRLEDTGFDLTRCNSLLSLSTSRFNVLTSSLEVPALEIR